MIIKCPTGKIRIEKANYGRTDGNLCTTATINKTDCRAQESETIVKRKCDEKTNCSISVLNQVFGDPCGGIKKYLEVNFTCV